MKNLIKLVRIASKESFIKLRNLWEIKCNSLWKNFKVTNLFLRHISWSSKWRKIKDIIERLSSISLIEKIAEKWILVETRKNPIIEWYRYEYSYKIKLNIKNIDFFIILWDRKTWETILISVFLNYLKQ
jgi:hypothetical protein